MSQDRRRVRRPPGREVVVSHSGDRWYAPDGTEMVAADIANFPVPLNAREGVFGHWLKCPRCRCEFLHMSWRANRPAEVGLRCPECSSPAYWLASITLNQRRDFAVAEQPSGEGAVEIYNLAGLIQAKLGETP